MPNVSTRPTVTEARNRLAALVRDEVANAAGSDRVLQDVERDQLTPFVRDAAAGLGANPSVNAVVDATMAQAVSAWAGVNQSSGSGKAWLSQAEQAAIANANPALGVLTRGAIEIAAKVKGTRPPLAVTLDAPPGIAMGVSGVRTLTVGLSAGPSVAVGTAFAIVVDGQRLAINRGPAGLSVDSLQSPPGYGIEVVTRSLMTEPTATATLKITRDAETALTEPLLQERAAAGLLAYVKNDRLDDADWSQYFPTTWSGAEAAVTAGIAKLFADPETEVQRKKDTITYIGRGPYDLYTEVTVDKRSGKVTNAYVEID